MKKRFDTVIDRVTGKPVAGATVNVLTAPSASGGTPVTIYSDNGVTPLDTLVSNELGYFEYYVADGAYTEEYSYEGTVLVVIQDVEVVETDDIRTDFAANTGGALVGFLQQGDGAVATTVQSKLRDLQSSPVDTGVTADGATNDYSALQAVIDAISSAGGGTFLNRRGATIRVTSAPILKDDVTLDLNGGKLLMALTGNGGYNYGLRLRNRAKVCNGEIEVQSSGTLGSQAGIHACINVGPMYGDGGTVASPSADEGVSGWTIERVKLTSDAAGKGLISIIGGASNGQISQIEVGDSANAFYVIGMDWGYLGSISSTATNAVQTANKTAYNAGTAYTTHPNNITIDGVKAGALTRTNSGGDTGSFLLRLSGCYGIRASNIGAKETTLSAVLVTGGDLGREFAPADVRQQVNQNIVIDGVTVQDCNNGYGVFMDSEGDNIRVAIADGYVPLTAAQFKTNNVIRNATFVADGGASVTYGANLTYITGGSVENCTFYGFLRGVAFRDGCIDTRAVETTTIFCREHGVSFDDTNVPPLRCKVVNPVSYLNGQSGSGFAQVYFGDQNSCQLNGGELGELAGGTETASYGIKTEAFADGCLSAIITERPRINSHKTAGAAHLFGADESWGCVRLFAGAEYGSGVTSRHAGLSIVPVEIVNIGATDLTIYRCAAAKLSAGITPPAGFVCRRGDEFRVIDPSAGAAPGGVCTTAGTVGSGAVVKAIASLAA